MLEVYKKEFGETNICHSAIVDFTLVESNVLVNNIIPFLKLADEKKQKVVVHCSAGIGRTGQILAAWLVNKYSFIPKEACEIVMRYGRNPYEAVGYSGKSDEELYKLHLNCKN